MSAISRAVPCAEPSVSLPVLKGVQFSDRMASVFSTLSPVAVLPDMRYRKIMIPAVSGGELHFAMLGLIAKALEQRGAEVTLLLCDALLPACAHRKIDHYESACTRWCHRNAGTFAHAMRLRHRWYSEFISPSDIEACHCRAEQIMFAASEHPPPIDPSLLPLIMQSTTSYFKVGAVDFTDPVVLAHARKLTASALMLQQIASRACIELAPDKVFMDNGVQVDWGVFRSVALAAGVPVDVVQTAPRPNTLQFEFDRPDSKGTVRMPMWETWKHEPLTPEQEQRLDEYLMSRGRVPYLFKNESWSYRVTDPEVARQMLQLPAHRPNSRTFVMFTNVGYDEGVTKGSPAFMTGAAWIEATVRFFASRPQHTLIIKAHPGEKHLGARDPIHTIIASACEVRPENLIVIDADSPITAPCAARLGDVALLYTSTVTVEAAAMNIPMILVGDGLHSRRGFALEPASASEYLELLAHIVDNGASIPPPGPIGRRYAYAYFFRSAIPLALFDRLDHELATIHISSATDLGPGCSAALDAICNGILRDDPIVNPSA